MKNTENRIRNKRVNGRLNSQRQALVEAIEPRILMTTDTWTGGAGNNLWNSATNWQANAIPAAGDSVVFPSYGSSSQTPINLSNNVTVGDITLNGNYQLSNDAITVNGNITTGASDATIQSNLVLNHNATISAASTDAIVLYGIGDGGNQYGITEQGSGTVILRQSDTYTGATVVVAGTLQVQATIASAITVDSGGLLDATASFTAPSLNTAIGATVVLESVADVTLSGPVTLGSGSTLNDRISSTSNGELIASGSSINLTGSSLSIQTVSYTPTLGHVFTVISNQTGSGVTGTFSGLAQGDITAVSGTYYQINYYGGQSGHDVTLTVVSQPDVWTDGSGNGNWSTAGNWQGNNVPYPYQSVEFPNLGSTDGTINLSGSVPVGTMTFDGAGYAISGNYTLQVYGNIAANSGTTLVTSNVLLGENTNVYVPSGSSHFYVTGTVSDGGWVYGLTEYGAGELALQGSVTYTGVTTVDQGSFSTQENMAAGVVVNSAGQFTAASVSVPGITSNAGNVSLSWFGNPEDITFSGNVILNGGKLSDPIESNGSGGFTTGEMTATGSSVNLGSSILQITPYSNYAPSLATVITLISNQTGSAVIGTFSGLPQGAVAHFGSSYYQVSYTGGTSHQNVTLTVVAQPVAHVLSIAQQPSGAAAGQAIGNLVVDVLDQYGNILSSDNSTVQVIAVNTTNYQIVALSGTTSVNASSGVATFSNLAQDTAGNYVFTISSSDGLPVATTNTVTVTPAAANQVVFLQQPVNTVAGQTMAPIEVEVVDQFGNVVTNNNSGVVVQNFPNVLKGTITASVINGIATFSDLYITQAGTYTINASDSNLTASNSSSFTVTPAAAAQLAFLQQPVNTVAGQTMAPIEVAVEDQYQNIVTSNVSGVVVQNFPNVLNGTISAAVVNGVATFNNLNVTTAGTYTINASDASLAATNSSSFSITPAAATQLAFVQQPANAIAGQTMADTEVAVEDAYGNIVTTNTSNVVVQNSPNVLNGTLSESAINGVATFKNLNVTKAGTYTINASDGNLSTATSNSFAITSAAATKLVVAQQPTATTAGQSVGNVVVDIEDSYGNLVTTDQSEVTIAAASTGVALPASALAGTTTVTAQNGVAVFSNLSLTLGGAYALQTTDAALTSADAQPITISNIASHMITAGKKMPTMAITSSSAYGQSIAHAKSLTVQLENESTGVMLLKKNVHVSKGKATISNMVVKKAGNYVMLVSDGQGHTMTETYTIEPSSASLLVFATQPVFVNGTASVSVNVVDAYGNLATSADNKIITLKLASHSTKHPSLSGTLTAAVVNGQAIFANVEVDAGDRARLTASLGKIRPAISGVFTSN